MTPAQLEALLQVHRRVNDPQAHGGRSSTQPGSTMDLLAFQRMRAG